MQSVHLQLYPDLKDIIVEHNIIEEMDLIRKICNAVLSIRKQKNIKVRMPLSKLYILSDSHLSLNQESVNILKEELNIKDVVIGGDFKIQKQVQLNFPVCGKAFGSDMAKISGAVKSGQYKKINDIEIECSGFLLSQNQDHFSYKILIENLDEELSFGSVDTKTVVILDCSTNQELEDECSARDLIRAVQNSRKQMNLEIMDKIKIYVDCSDSKIYTILSSFKERIESQTLSTIMEVENPDFKENVDLHNFNQVTLKISKI